MKLNQPHLEPTAACSDVTPSETIMVTVTFCFSGEMSNMNKMAVEEVRS